MKYTTREECVEKEIIERLGAYVDEYDVEEIAAELIEQDGNGMWYIPADVEEFWRVAEENDILLTI